MLPNVKDLSKAIVCAVLLAPAFGGCSSEKNHEERMLAAPPPKDAKCIDQCVEPDPTNPLQVPVVDCAAEEVGLEFLRVWDFETATPADPAPRYLAQSLYQYDDDTTQYRIPGDYEPDAIVYERCADKAGNHALHFYGGPFLGWGGGVGRQLYGMLSGAKVVRADRSEEMLSCAVDPKPDFCPKEGAEFPRYVLDLSAWEGISFWARRGPDSQEGFRVLIGDKHTDDDMSFLTYRRDPSAPRYCERTKECGCKNRKPCTFFTPPPSCGSPEESAVKTANDGTPCTPQGKPLVTATEYCFDPATDPTPQDISDLVTDGLLSNAAAYTVCGNSKCIEEYPAFPESNFSDQDSLVGGKQDEMGGPTITEEQQGDAQFKNYSCTEYAFAGGIVGDYCYDPANGPEPARAEDTCGDHWMKAVHLTTEWQFYKVPFTDLLQQGWAKEFTVLDITEATLLRFTWDRGWADFYIDDVSFYRRVE